VELFDFATSVDTEIFMINRGAAWEAAHGALRSHLIEGDPLFTPWVELEVSDPRLVSDVSGKPSYWAVPLLCGCNTVGFVRVMSDGTVAAIGITCHTPETPEACPVPTFALSPEDVESRFLAESRLQSGEKRTEPKFVHDGPPGREVWLIETRRDGLPSRWIFVGQAGIYERRAGIIFGTGPEME
jgi:hypothetical protein